MEFMSNLQGGVDHLKPSLFELLSEQQLASLIPPSLRYVLAVATHRHPRYLLRILNSFDELYALLMLLVERHYLKLYGGGFTENFYSLKRERVLRIKGGEVPRAQLGAPGLVRETLKLRHSDVWKNLAVMVGLPYMKRKLDESYDIHAPQATILGPSFNRDVLPPNPTLRQRFMYYYKWFLRNVYPSVNAAYYFSLLAFNLAYLFDASKYHSPFLWLIGTRMRRLGEADHRAIALATQGQPPPAGSGARPGQTTSVFSPQYFTTTVYPRLLSSLKILLPTSIFALKFLEWWHASDFARQLSRKAAEGLELPPPIISGLSLLSPPKQDPRVPTTKSSEPGSDSSTLKPTQPTRKPLISATTSLPIFTVQLPGYPPVSNSSLCPICLSSIITPTATPYGFAFCYTCIHKWVDGTHPRQEAFMEGGGGDEEGWLKEDGQGSRQGRWESGKGRCAVSGKRILGGTEGLRRVMVKGNCSKRLQARTRLIGAKGRPTGDTAYPNRLQKSGLLLPGPSLTTKRRKPIKVMGINWIFVSTADVALTAAVVLSEQRSCCTDYNISADGDSSGKSTLDSPPPFGKLPNDEYQHPVHEG